MSDNLDKTHPAEDAARHNFSAGGEVQPVSMGHVPSSAQPDGISPVTPISPDEQVIPATTLPGELVGQPTAAADAATPETLQSTVLLDPDGNPLNSTAPLVDDPVDSNAPATTSRRRKSFWREVLETVILTILIFFLVKSMVQNFRIQGSSMEPSFHTNQLLLVNKAAYFHFDVNAWLRIIPGVKAEGTSVAWIFGGPHRGDVVVFEPPDVPTEDYIKRVIGLPGDKVEVRDGTVYVNDKALKEDYIKEKPYNAYGPVTVPSNALFVMGDNRNASRDSRIFGFLPFDKIVGKAMFVYWPFGNQWGIVPEVKQE